MKKILLLCVLGSLVFAGLRADPGGCREAARAVLTKAQKKDVERFGSLHDFCYPLIYGFASELTKRPITENFATLLHEEAKLHSENHARRAKFEDVIYPKKYIATIGAHNIGELMKWTPKVGQRGTDLLNIKGTVTHVQKTTSA